MNTNDRDWLKPLFSRLPVEALPPSFCQDTMKRITEEALKQKQRSEWKGWLLIILASLGMLGLGVAAVLYVGLPHFHWTMPELTGLPFYLFIGILSLLLLGFDHLMRQAYKKKHP